MKLKISTSKGFSLIEMIGVLAIIGILASVVAPKVFDAIRDAKITGAVGIIQTIKSSCTDYARKYNNFPLDGNKAPVQPYTRPYGDGATLATGANSTLGDILIGEGMLEKLTIPIGPNGTPTAVAYTTAGVTLVGVAGTAATKPVNAAAVNYPLILSRTYASLGAASRLFSSAQNSTRVVFILLPGLTTLEAAGLKTKIDGPFNDSIIGASDLVTQSVNGTGTGSVAEAVNRGNCLLTNSTLATGGYDAWCYVAHE
jgi:prepilin-type N-terminal cleavage/methylation domain-containing protein